MSSHVLHPQPHPAANHIGHWRDHLSKQRAKLKTQFLVEGDARQCLNQHCRLVDDLLRSIWRNVIFRNKAALVAVGGYGRTELYPYSDVDLLVLLPNENIQKPREQLEPLVGLFWDVGLEVSHSVRTLDECTEESVKDATVQTNLLEARLIAGNQALFKRFVRNIISTLNVSAFFEAKLLEQQQRHTRYRDTAYNLEPNLKDSPGGLRDLQNILWISRAAGLGKHWNNLADHAIITRQEARQIIRRETFLRNLRVYLHYLAQRREDRLLFDLQAVLAHRLHFSSSPHRMASEQLMQRYYQIAKFNSVMNELLLQKLRTRLFPSPQEAPHPIGGHFQSRHQLLELRRDDFFEKHPGTILEIFLIFQQNPELKGLSSPTLHALWRARRKIDARFRKDSRNNGLFMDILRQPRRITYTLRRMNQYGILGRYLRPFGQIVGRMQHDLFHEYTVDEHILFVLRNLRRFTLAEFAHEFPLCSQLISTYERPEILYVAALFHDIAKGRGGDHSVLGKNEAQQFCRQHDLDEQDTQLITWLVENHLVMSATAQKQDLSDPGIIAAFAGKVMDERHLVSLYLLTVADIRGTSPKVWNIWKDKLLQELFFATQRYLSGESFSLSSHLQTRQIEALRILRLNAYTEKTHEALWAELDESYFLRHEPDEIAWHTRMIDDRIQTVQPIVKARLASKGEGIQVMIYTRDQNDLFARISGFFGRIHYNIVEAKIHTSRHGYALDSFLVLDETGKSIHYRDFLSYMEHELTERLASSSPADPALPGKISRRLKHFPIVPQVKITPDEKGTYHILSVTAGDRPGLLSQIAQVFLKHKIRLRTAKITTLGERVEDTFLVTADENRLNDQRAILQFEQDLLGELKLQ